MFCHTIYAWGNLTILSFYLFCTVNNVSISAWSKAAIKYKKLRWNPLKQFKQSSKAISGKNQFIFKQNQEVVELADWQHEDSFEFMLNSMNQE